jgi:hypothetical protein
VDTVREPLLVLDGDFCVLAVSRSYYLTFRVDRQDVLGRPLYALGDGQWHIPALRMLLEKIIPERAAMDGFEVEHEFPRIGRRIMLLNGTVTLPNRARNKSAGMLGSRRGDDVAPRLHRRGPEGSVRFCRGEMALDVESVVSGCVG